MTRPEAQRVSSSQRPSDHVKLAFEALRRSWVLWIFLVVFSSGGFGPHLAENSHNSSELRDYPFVRKQGAELPRYPYTNTMHLIFSLQARVRSLSDTVTFAELFPSWADFPLGNRAVLGSPPA